VIWGERKTKGTGTRREEKIIEERLDEKFVMQEEKKQGGMHMESYS